MKGQGSTKNRGVMSRAAAPKPEKRTVIDLKRIVDALQGAGCAVREMKYSDSGYLTVVLEVAPSKSISL